MKKSKTMTYVLIIIVIIMLMVSSLFSENEYMIDKIITIITTATAMIGAIAIFIQFKKDKNINQANFILNYGKYFHEVKGNDEINEKLEKYQQGQKDIFNESDNMGIINCLVWCEGLSVLIQDGTLELCKIDNLFSYTFFLIVNNEYIQKHELVENAEYYKGVYALHRIWTDYKRKTRQPILNEETDLSKTKEYKEYTEKGDLLDKKHF